MSKCELTVELDEPKRRYRCGEPVTGRVHVRTDGEVTCRKLVIEQVWRTHGRGNQAEGVLNEHVEGDQRWLAGQVHEVPFSFLVPAAPINHHGHLVNVDHYVTARADLPWKLDPRAHADYLVVPSAETPVRYVETEADFGKAAQKALQERTKKAKKSPFRWVWSILLTPLAIVLVVLVLGLLLVLLPIVLVVGLVGWIVRITRQGSAERKLGAVEVVVGARKLGDPGEAHTSVVVAGGFAAIKRRMRRLGGATYLVTIGSPVTLAVRFTPKSDITIDSATLTVTAKESARSGSGTNATTHQHVLAELTTELSGPRLLPAGQPIHLHGEILLPAGSAPSFTASDNNVTWEMKLAIEIPKWPDWVQTNKLLVVPAVEE
ncbi:MAG TPA: hypothetical protein VNB06_16355 [Thermoanaerobaculia bacterium]|nr:hypothetical protein [Thermoanaerobaculia bacterium]